MINADNLADAARFRLNRLDFPWAFDARKQSFAQWRAATLELVHSVLETADLVVPQAAVVDTVSFGDHSTHHLRLSLAEDETADAYFLAPHAPGRFPAVLLLHDHGSEFRIGKEKMIAPWGDPAALALHQNWIARLYGGRAVGVGLVRRGYAVLCVDAIGWGSRVGNGYEAQQALAANLMQTGTSLAAVIAREDVQAVKFLAAHPLVDPTRIATLGFSFGGFRAWQTAALSDGIAATVSANWMGSLAGLLQPSNNMLRGQSAFYMLHPSLAGKLDFPDIAALIAPRPAAFLAGKTDRHFPPQAVTPAFSSMAAVWLAAEAQDRLHVEWHDGGHSFDAIKQEQAFDWLDKSLGRCG